MKLPPELTQRIDAYLREVEQHLGHKSVAVRRELVGELRDHITEALRRKAGEKPSPADLEAVLAEMDPPESFADAPAAPLGAVTEAKAAATGLADPPARRGGGANRWFLLALAFLAINGYGVWKLTQHAAPSPCPADEAAELDGLCVVDFEGGDENGVVTGKASLSWSFSAPVATPGLEPRIDPPQPGEFSWPEPDRLVFTPSEPWRPCRTYTIRLDDHMAQADGKPLAGERSFEVGTPPLTLLRVEQVHCSPAREVTLRLFFNAAPKADLLQKYLHLSEEGDSEVGYELAGRAGSNVVMVKTEALDQKQLEVELLEGLPAMEGPLGTMAAVKTTLPVVTTFEFLRADTASPAFEACRVRAFFSSKPEANGIADRITIEPAVRFTTEPLDSYWEAGFVLTGEFKPGSVYKMKIAKGLPSAAGAELSEAVERTIQFPNRPSSLAFTTGGRYLSPRGKLLVPVSAMNVRTFTASVSPVFANNLVHLAHRDTGLDDHYGPAAQRLTGRAVTRTNLLEGRVNEAAKTALSLRDYTDSEPSGVYWMEIQSEQARDTEGRLLVITDLGLSARRAADGVLVWVNSLREARPVGQSEVVLYAINNQILARAATDTNGLAFLPCQPDDEPFLVTAKSAVDFSYLDLSRTGVEAGEGLGGVAYLAAGDVEASVLTERGVYRPGETAHLQAIVRDAKLAAPKSFPALFRVRRPDGRIFKDLPVTLDAYGSTEASVVLPEYLPTGRYTLEFALPGTFTVLGQTTVALEDFVPPQIRVQLEPPKARTKGGEAIGFKADAQHLFGRPAAGLSARGSVSFKAAPFAPAAWKDWKFGDGEKAFSTVYRQSVTQLLDEDGKAEFAFESSAAWRPPAAIQAVQQVTVMELNGRAVTAYGSSFLDVYPFYIGLRMPVEGTLRVGEIQRVEVVEILPDGTAAKDSVPLVMKLARVQWNSVLRRNSDNRYEWKSERTITTVREQTLAAGGTASAWTFAVDSSGEYLVTATDPASGASSSVRFHAAAADQQWVEWSREKPDHVALTLDRERYHPGDAAKLLIKAPFSGLALLTIESDRVLDRRLITLDKNTAEVEVPVKADYTPNVYCSVTLIRPAVAESVWSAHRATGSAVLRVEPPARRLIVAIDAPATNRPQAKMRARITVRDESGAPAQGDVTAMAVDEAICMLTSFTTPDPMQTFLAQRGLGVSVFDIYRDLMPVIDDAVAGVSHTGGDDETALRRRLNPIKANRFKPVALWKSGIHLDAKGQAEVEFDVPEFTGELRLMAVAYNATQTGSADASTLVKRSLVVQPSLPRFLAPGDTCDASIELFNESGRPLPVQIRLTCGGPLSADKAEETVSLKAGGSASLRLPIRAGTVPGKALCTFEVSGGTESYRETIELAVRPAAGLQVAAHFGVLKAGERKEIAAPADWVRESVVREVWLSGQPALKLGRALDYVMHYPYGCLEQTVSGSFPLLYAADIANRILPGSAARQDVSAYVQSGIFRMLSMQMADGSFSLWPNGSRDEHATLYTIHFFLEARKAAYPIPADRLDAAHRWLRERMDANLDRHGGPDEPGWVYDMGVRAYIAHLLALAGKPDHGWNARLREQAERLEFSSRLHVASALLLSGEPQQATAMLGQLELPKDGHRDVDGLLNSPVCNAALLLSTWLDIDPANVAVERLVHELDRQQIGGHWMNTKDDAMALLALGKYAQRVPADQRPYTGLLSLPGGLSRSASNTQEVHWVGTPGEQGAVTVVNDGPGTLYYSARSEGVPAAPERDSDAGLKIRRSFVNAEGVTIDPASVKQGDLIIVILTLDTMGRSLNNIAVEELLPAGWEIENPNLATSEAYANLKEKTQWVQYRDLRDDRLILFSGPMSGANSFWYAARAVTPGRYVLPPAKAECMYAPEIRSVHGTQQVEVKP